MPVYEYFCPHCSRELEVLRPIGNADGYSDCPDCGGKAWRLVSGFGSKTGSYLQPAGMPFREESGWQPSEGTVVATVTKSDVGAGSMVDDKRASLSVEMSWLLESQPNGSNLWFMQDWGIASILRYLREDLDAEVAELAAKPRERSADLGPGVDQRVELASVRPWPDDKMVGPARVTEPDARPTNVPMVAYAEHWIGDQSGEPAMAAGPEGQATGALVRYWLPVSYFGWFMLMVACIAAIVVPLVWFLAVAA